VADVHLSRRAYADLAEMDDYGAREYGEAAAEAYQLAFDRAFERLADFPRIGEAKPEFGQGLRSLACGQHRILYRIEQEIVQIVCVLHHSQDVLRNLPQ
jgi:toxin ParE1/3/4